MRICFIGDSFINGTGDPECLGWAGRICATACNLGYDITYYNLGVRRETSADIRARWLREVSGRLSAADDGRIVFSFGMNDTTLENGKTRIEFSSSIENTRNILNSAKQMFPVLMVGPPATVDAEQNHRTGRLSNSFAAVCYELDLPYLDIFTPLQSSDIWMREAVENDGSHPRSAGYAKLAQLIQNWIPWLSWFK